jgi:hypothetical protein
VCVALGFAKIIVGWTAETIPSEKLICKVDFSSWVAESLTISPDSKRVAYVAKEGTKAVVVINGKEEKQYDGIVKGSIIKFGSDGSFYYLAGKGNGFYLVTSQGLTKAESESKATPNEIKSEESK